MANRILLWRHGQTDWNTVNRFQGHSDIPLNAVGQYQAKHAANILIGMQPTKIISSDLSRARETAQALANLANLSVEVDIDLRETNGGLWEGKTGAENRAEDFQNFVKLAYMAHSLHHSGGTICEPVDLPVNKRHFDMVYSHMKYSDKPFMGSVTAPERAEDTIAIWSGVTRTSN